MQLELSISNIKYIFLFLRCSYPLINVYLLNVTLYQLSENQITAVDVVSQKAFLEISLVKIRKHWYTQLHVGVGW